MKHINIGDEGGGARPAAATPNESISIKAGQLFLMRHEEPVRPRFGNQCKPTLKVLAAKRDPDGKLLLSVVRCDYVSMAYLLSGDEMERSIASGDYTPLLVDENPANPGIRCAEDIPGKKRQKKFTQTMLLNMARLRPVLALGWGAFNPKRRAKVLQKIATSKSGGGPCTVAWLRKLLWKYWAGGALALGAGYHRCGSITRAEKRHRIRSGQSPKEDARPGAAPPVVYGQRATAAYDRGGCHITAKDEGIIEAAIDDFLDDDLHKEVVANSVRHRKSLPWTKMQEVICGKLRKTEGAKHLHPSVPQVRYIGMRTVNLQETKRAVLGARYVDLNERAFNGDSRDVAFYAGHRYEIDGVHTDIHLVDDTFGFPIGRANVVFIVDTYSGMITGAYVTTEDLTFAHVSRALHAAFSPKRLWLKTTVDLDILDEEYPADGRCDHVTADNAQLVTDAAATIPELIADSGICRPYRPDDKALVESSAFLANIGHVHFYRYGVTKGPKQRAQDDPARDAVVSVHTFTRELYRWIYKTANHRVLPKTRQLDPAFYREKKAPTPFNYWTWSCKVHGGPPQPYNSAEWMPRLLERVMVTVSASGLYFEGLYWDDRKWKALVDLKTDAAGGKALQIPAHIDRLTDNFIYLVPADISQSPRPVPLSHLSRNYANLSLAEVKLKLAHENALRKLGKDEQVDQTSDQLAAQAAATKADKQAVLDRHGSIEERNRTADSTDIDAVASEQAKNDNALISKAMHGEGVQTSDDDQPKAKPVTPSSYL